MPWFSCNGHRHPRQLRLKKQTPLSTISISARTFGRWRSQWKLPSRRVQFRRRPAGQLVYPRVTALQPTLRFPLLRSKPLSSALLGGHNKTEPRRARTVGCCSPSEPDLPTVVCAPLRVCLIELQPGEKLVGEPQIGDSVRWNVAPATFGKGDESTAMLVLKPQMPGLDTNLLITTDRRAYYVRLVSKANDYVSRVAFVYNDDDGGKKWKDHFAEQKREELAAARNSVQTQPAVLFCSRAPAFRLSDQGRRRKHSPAARVR